MTQELQTLPVAKIKASPDNFRKSLGDVEGLAKSIESVGLLEPILVEPNGSGWLVVAGHRRLEATKLAGLKEIPCIVRAKADDGARVVAMIVENLQREDIAPVEEAEALQRLIDITGYSQEEAGKAVGVNQSHVSKRLQLLKLPESVRKKVDAGGIPVAAGVALAKLSDDPKRVAAAIKEAEDYDSPLADDFERVVDEQLQEIETERQVAEIRAELKAGGAKVLDMGKPQNAWSAWRLPTGTLKVTNDRYAYGSFVQMAPAKHAKEPCRAVCIDPSTATVIELCTNPSAHPKADTSRQKPKETPAQRRAKDHEKAVREATRKRREFLEGLVKKRIPKGELVELAAIALVEESWSDKHKIAGELLGLELVETTSHGRSTARVKTIQAALEQHARKGETQATQVLLAMSIANHERSLSPSAYRGWGEEKAYFTFLRRHGYRTGEAERLELDGKGPR